MAKRILEGLWDCPYCKAKGIGGLTKHCPCCGHPQDDDVKFYLGEKKNYLEDELAAQYGQGADWVCAYCGSLNRVHYQYCANCAGSKDSSKADYFDAKTPRDAQATAAKQSDQPKRPGKKRWLLPALLIALVAFVVILFWPHTYDATVSSASWAREIDVEAYRTVQESNWTVPDGGRVYDTKSEFSHFIQVLDHYETRTREVSESVYDGEDEQTSYTDNGDGTFTEDTYTTPRYRTEWHTETYQEPIYRNEPVYALKYYYDIDKWLTDRTEASKGTDNDPDWPPYTLAKNERTGSTRETYVLSIAAEKDSYQVSLPLELWTAFHKGDTVKITVVNGKVTKINDQAVE